MSKEKEWQTRKFRIDTRLTSIPDPWEIRKYNSSIDIKSLHGTAIEEYPTDNGPADYVFIVNGKIVGILEAKKVSVNPQNVLEQAKRYYYTLMGWDRNTGIPLPEKVEELGIPKR